MAHIKPQKLISSTQVRGYGRPTQYTALDIMPRDIIKLNFCRFMCYERWTLLHVAIKRQLFLHVFAVFLLNFMLFLCLLTFSELYELKLCVSVCLVRRHAIFSSKSDHFWELKLPIHAHFLGGVG